jgi:putative transposase
MNVCAGGRLRPCRCSIHCTRLLVEQKAKLLPKHPLAEAIGYTLNQWRELTLFTTDPAVPLHNNLAEQQMKRIALLRKNALFAGSPRGGETAAILSSLTSTCRRHDINPQAYLTQLLANLPDTPISRVDEWLPDRWKKPSATPSTSPHPQRRPDPTPSEHHHRSPPTRPGAVHSADTLREGRRPKQVGRPKIVRDVRGLVIRLAKENSGWGYRRIIGELRKLRVRVCRSSVRRILKDEGLTPSPTRRGRADETVWRKFLRLHMNTLVACDFFTKAVITPFGVRLAYSLAFIHLGTRKVFLSPPTYHPQEQWVQQQARNLMMWLEDQQLEARFLIHDWDSKFSAAFRALVRSAGIRPLRTPKLAPDANAFCEAWIGALKREALDYFLCFSLSHLDHIAQEFVRFHNAYRPHQGLGNRTIPAAAHGPPAEPRSQAAPPSHRIRCQCFLGGLLRHYYREAA